MFFSLNHYAPGNFLDIVLSPVKKHCFIYLVFLSPSPTPWNSFSLFFQECLFLSFPHIVPVRAALFIHDPAALTTADVSGVWVRVRECGIQLSWSSYSTSWAQLICPEPGPWGSVAHTVTPGAVETESACYPTRPCVPPRAERWSSGREKRLACREKSEDDGDRNSGNA